MKTERKRALTKATNTSIQEYDSDGYHIIELDMPSNYFMMKYNDNHMKIISKKEIVYDGPGTENARKDIEQQLRLLDNGLCNMDFNSNLDSQEWLDLEMEELNDLIEDFRKKYTYSAQKDNANNSFNFGETVLFLTILSVILYGLTQLGEFLVNLFKSLLF